MKVKFSILFLLFLAHLSFSSPSICPDPPINDDPCITSDNPPYDLTGGGTHMGTTCCARGPDDENPDGSAADFENADCSAAAEDAAVWYQYTPDETDDGYNIILDQGDAEGPISLEVYTGVPDAGCTGALTFIVSSCGSNTADIKIGNCFEPGDIMFVKIATDDPLENCGTFILTIIPATCGPMADDCIDLADQDPIEPETANDFSINYFCVNGCLDYACPEDDTNGGCPDMTEMPTVWVKVITDDMAAQMFTTVEPFGNWTPIWAVYSGPDCDNLTVVNFGGSPPCSNGDNTPELHQTSVFCEEENYWVAITIDPSSLPPGGLDDGGFELCVATTNNPIICLGELEGGACDDESLIMEVTERELENLPLDGPFAQGEEITIEISFFYDASDSGADWLMGIVPRFGQGWDLSNFDYATSAPVGNGQTAVWYEEGSNFAPAIQEPNPILCTYTDADGNLQICNLLCSSCPECPVQWMAKGDPLPSGYFWVSEGTNLGCENDGSPGEGWGIGSTQAQVDWTFTLSTKVFDNETDCSASNDLSISFQTFSQGSVGCWEDPVGECLLDRMMSSPSWVIGCEAPPAVIGFDQEICYNVPTDIELNTANGSTDTIIVIAEDNPLVTGEMDHIFYNGEGTIQDDLLNLTSGIQYVKYFAQAQDASQPNQGPINEIIVTVYPEIKGISWDVSICLGDCKNLGIDTGGAGTLPYSYTWSNGDTTRSTKVCPTIPTTYFVTIEDAVGCTKIVERFVDIKPEDLLIIEDTINVIIDDEFDPLDPQYITCIEALEGWNTMHVDWDIPTGLVGYPTNQFHACFVINEAESTCLEEGDEPYILRMTVYDFGGCEKMDSIVVYVTGECIETPEYKLIYDFFVDVNEDGIKDSLDLPFADGSFILDPGNTIYYNTDTDPDTLMLSEGEYTLTYNSAGLPDWEITTDSTFTITIDSLNNCITVEFGLKLKDSVRDAKLYNYWNRRCNTDQFYYLIIKNQGDRVENGILWAELDEEVLYEDFANEATVDTFIAPNKVGWFFEGLLPKEKLTKSVTIHIPGPPDFPVGGILNHKIYAELNNSDGSSEIWEQRNVSGSVQCGFDPNDKAVEPSHEEGYTNIEQDDLVFKIRFQNTGNDVAEDIVIRDTLSEYVNLSTIEYLGGSHDEFLSLSRESDNVLLFEFNNINLPDSTSNLELSKGFLIYKVELQEDLPEGTIIENTANIFFDYNPPITTNTTQSILYEDLDQDGFYSIEDCDDENGAINPMADEIPNNDIDEDCDGVAIIIDNDMDGFNSDEDCDDENAEINPDAEEIINNMVDENCDNLVVIIDVDMDGFNSDEDCDDEDTAINPDAVEIANNEIDEDCDGEALVVDVDMDGFNSDEDCDDEDASINPDAVEIANNEVDEDCDGEALIIDVDMDGFNSDEDCDDMNADINPDAFDIPENGIDEDCDGMDAVTSDVNELEDINVLIHPNPSNDAFNIIIRSFDGVNYTIYDVMKREVQKGKFSSLNETIYLGQEPNGVYIILLSNPKFKQNAFYRLLKI
jgi:hypothetical protein